MNKLEPLVNHHLNGRRAETNRTVRRRGACMVLLAVLFPVVLAIAAYAINVVYMELARTELQITTDVAARAAGRVLAVTGSQQQAVEAAERLMEANPFVNETLSQDTADILFGISTRLAETERYSFREGQHPNAVCIAAKGKVQVPMLFPTMGIPVDFRPTKSSISTQTVLDIALVIDRSGSMAYAANESSNGRNPRASPRGWAFGLGIPPDARWTDAVNAVDGFLNLMKESSHDEHVSLSSYSSKSKTDVNLTDNYDAIDRAMANYSAKFEGGSTNIGDGILEGAKTLSDKAIARPWATRVMIVLTDGIHNVGTDPYYAAQRAAAENILIYTVTFSNEADTSSMEHVAQIGSGKHFHAVTADQLAEAFEDIARSLPTLITY